METLLLQDLVRYQSEINKLEIAVQSSDLLSIFIELEMIIADYNSNYEKLDKLILSDIEYIPNKLPLLATFDKSSDGANSVQFILNRTKEVFLTANHIKTAYSGYLFDNYVVNLEFTPEGAIIFYEVTANAIGESLSIVVLGETITSPTINEPISNGKAIISGNLTQNQANELAEKIMYGKSNSYESIKSNYLQIAVDATVYFEKAKDAGFVIENSLSLFT